MNKNCLKYILSIPLIVKFKVLKSIFGLNYVSNALEKISFHYATPFVLRSLGADIGSSVTIIGRLSVAPGLKGFSTLTIEDNVFIGKNVFLDLAGQIKIGKNTAVSANCMFVTHGDPGWRSKLNAYYKPKNWTIDIGEDCWLGASVLISRPHTCKNCSIIASGSVVTADLIPEESLYKSSVIKKLYRI